MQLLDGKLLSENIKAELAAEVDQIKLKGGKIPHLAAVLIGENPASQVYVNSKIKSCEQIGFTSTLVRRPSDVSEEEVLKIVADLNNDPDVDGFIVQLPLPKHIDEEKIMLAIDYRKDVDGFHPVNFGRMAQGMSAFLPATPFGILEMLRRYNIETSGKHCVVLGRSNIVGTPISILLSRKGYPGDCTVTLTHSRTKDLPAEVRRADIVVAAIGIPQFVKGDWVKEGAVVIDVGINRIPDASRKSGSRLVGDVDFDSVAPKCSHITPVPGGVGLMTVTALLMNTLKACRNEIYEFAR
ncbi:MAG: bifunctional 5,10-methylene-tetrahydrofolate dehydrogenase/5,10-methylene-tetrahydrofolate cyclohydrolase [Lewinellaceae bacterium]|nr:bifunctional 5,10-methylene-tetrahydrofolate dehydrogenase/5,10-methylene-tetrahydrofolate cyclohydrolase [Saprospiraceae bacterium]MCB9316525.1 bifunctional 5,10-methylene-tetrahydrofolate dehydrogenase/5,10-methylene-tetrahydrofolate cyclohydrolase [Lewinellaceae bacterium]MCB9330487.1 bifunctional 5,10-methylene-tetrahydrofolate dehydrogenase/5,10-methylene-tetrahydrofolate cyclohydrolase [Lewinellaceae bacterium]